MRNFFSKIEPYIFYLFVFLIPFERRLIVARWTKPVNEWASAYIYITDILIFVLLLFWLARYKKELFVRPVFRIKSVLTHPALWLAAFFAVSTLSVFYSNFFAQIRDLSYYQLLKLAEFIALFFYFKSGLGKIFELRKTLSIVVASAFAQAVIGAGQYLKQGGLGLGFFGESPLSLNGTGVAVFIVNAQKHLRAYGLLPHPNLLAAWLFVGLFAFYYLYISSKEPREKRFWAAVIYVPMLFAFFATYSRTILGLWVLGVVFISAWLAYKKNISRRFVYVAFLTVVISVFFAVAYWPQIKSRIHIAADEEAVTQRVFYNKVSVTVAKHNPLLGVGIGQFVPKLMKNYKYYPENLYQPVHNIYLLVASEIGFIGLGFFLLFLFFLLWRFIRTSSPRGSPNIPLLFFALSFLAMGLFDHFPWTLQQGSLIFWLVLGTFYAGPEF